MNSNMNKKTIEQVRLIGHEIRERLLMLLLGLSMLGGFVSIIYFNIDISPSGFLESIGFLVIVLVQTFLLVVGLSLVVISFTDEGWNSEAKK